MKVVCIGGGTGTSVVLNGLKQYSDISLSVIVSMSDDGGSNAVVRDEFGLLPLSDLRKSIIALSNKERSEILRKLFVYRFDKGNGLSGHTLGNLIMIALSELEGSEFKAVKVLEKLFDVKGQIIPVTNDKTRLSAHYTDGTNIVGEHLIDTLSESKTIDKLTLIGNPIATKECIEEILNSKYIIVGPGDIYTTIVPNLLVKGVKEAILKSPAKIIYISNLMTKKGETRGLTHSKIVDILEKYIGRKLDIIFINNTKYSNSLLQKYKKDGESPIIDDLPLKSDIYSIIRTNLVSNTVYIKKKGDTLKRSYIRHDPRKLGKELYHIIRKNTFDIFSSYIKDSI